MGYLCKKCGKDVRQNDRVCKSCGVILEGNVVYVSPEATDKTRSTTFTGIDIAQTHKAVQAQFTKLLGPEIPFPDPKSDGRDWLLRTPDFHVLGPMNLEEIKKLLSSKQHLGGVEICESGSDWDAPGVFIDGISGKSAAAGETGRERRKVDKEPAPLSGGKKEPAPAAEKEEEKQIPFIQNRRNQIVLGLIGVFVAVLVFAILKPAGTGKEAGEKTEMADSDFSIIEGTEKQKGDVEKYYTFKQSIEKAAQFLEIGAYSEAYKLLSSAYDIKSDSIDVKLNLARLQLLYFKNFKQAKTWFQDIAASNVVSGYKLAEVYNYLGICSIYGGDYVEARGYLARALKEAPGFEKALLNLAYTYIDEGPVRVEEYSRNVKSARHLWPRKLVSMLVEYRKGKLLAATRLYDEVSVLKKKRVLNYFFRAWGLHLAGKAGLARAAMDKALAQDPEVEGRSIIDDGIYFTTNPYDIGIRVFDLLYAPDSEDGRRMRVFREVLGLLRDKGGAVKIANAERTLTGCSAATCQYMLALVLSLKNEFQKSTSVIERATGQGTFNKAVPSWVLSLAGENLSREGKYAQAEVFFKKALTVSPDSARAMYYWGELFWKMDKRRQAIDLWKKAIAARPDYAPPHKQLLIIKNSMTISQ